MKVEDELDSAIDAINGGFGTSPSDVDDETSTLTDTALQLQANAEIEWPDEAWIKKLAKTTRPADSSQKALKPALAGAGILGLLGGGVFLGQHLAGAPTAGISRSAPSFFAVPLGPQGSGTGGAVSQGAAPGAGTNSYAVTKDAASASPIYGYYNSCTPQPAHIDGNYITATAMGPIPADSSNAGASIYMQFNDNNGTLSSMRDKLNSLRDTIIAMGVPAEAISTSVDSYNYQGYAGSGGNKSVGGSLSVGVADLDLANKISNAGSDAGATSISVYSTPEPSSPSNDAVNSATASATSQAHTLAVAIAANAGARIGSLHSSEILPPMACYSNGQSQLVVEVILSYNMTAD